MIKNEKKKWTRKCPECGCGVSYSSKKNLMGATKTGSKCRRCARIGMNNPMYNKKHKPETIEKIKAKRKLQGCSDETRKKMSETATGKIVSDETRKRMSESFTGRVYSDKTRKNMSESRKSYFENMNDDEYVKYCKNRRLTSIKYWKTKFEVYPNYNKSSIPIIEAKAKELGITDLQHAENGGEYHIKELGYFVDGYSKEKNIVIEYYEKFHTSNIKKDMNRQQEITNLLKCKFIIIEE
jgi:hypothetical protein